MVWRLYLHCMYSVFIEFVCLFGLLYTVDLVYCIKNPISDFHKVFLSYNISPQVSSPDQG